VGVGAGRLSQVSSYDEILLHTCGPTVEVAGPPGLRTTRYHGWLYSRLPLPAQPADLVSIPPGAAPPREIGGLPLVGHEEITFHRRRYAEYLSAFYDGDEGLHRLQGFLADTLSPALLGMLRSPPAGSRLRAWWLNEAPELEDVPWEGVGLGWGRPARLSIARGRPRATVPPMPLAPDRPLTVALIDPDGLAPDPLRSALDDLGPAVAVVRIEEKDPRKALSEAARAGVEVVHLCADASVPLGVEGLLDFPGGATLMPAEAGELLRGSRAAILALAAPASPRVDRDGLPTVFHGFARFGRAMGDGLTVVAPLGPVAPPELARFWRTFYARFAETLDVEDALVEAAPCPLRTPLVLFLRHRFGRQFYRHAGDPDDVSFDPGGESAASPAQASADLAVSGELLDAAITLQERYAALGRPFPSGALIDRERERQQALAAYLDDALALAQRRER
jgi:hypothetical protein